MTKNILFVFILSIVVFGCHKPSQETPEPAPETQQANEAQQPQPEEAKPEEAKPEEVKPEDVKPEETKPFQADYSSKEFPEIHTQITTTDMPWGQIQRTTLLWSDDINIFHEIPVFKEDTPAFNKINASLKEVDQSFFTKQVLDSPWEYAYERHQNQTKEEIESDDKYHYTYTAEVTEMTEKYISIVLTMDWYMGGVNDGGYKTYTFDATTGEPIKLTDIYHKSEKDLKKLVTKAIRTHLSKNALSSDLIEWGSLEKHGEFSFYLKDGIPHATFNKYEIAVGAAGSFDIELPKP